MLIFFLLKVKVKRFIEVSFSWVFDIHYKDNDGGIKKELETKQSFTRDLGWKQYAAGAAASRLSIFKTKETTLFSCMFRDQLDQNVI